MRRITNLFTKEFTWERPMYFALAVAGLGVSVIALAWGEPILHAGWADWMQVGLLWAAIFYLSELRYRMFPDARGN